MAGIQFGQIVSFSLTLHTWELNVTSEVGRKMILLGHTISYVIYYQLQGHLRMIFTVLFGFSISEKTEFALFWYEYPVIVGCHHHRHLPHHHCRLPLFIATVAVFIHCHRRCCRHESIPDSSHSVTGLVWQAFQLYLP